MPVAPDDNPWAPRGIAGPEYIRGISRYEDFPDDEDFSDAIIDPGLESVGRLVRACSLLEIALFQALSKLDLRVTFVKAEWDHGPKGCIKQLRVIAPELTPTRVRQVRTPVKLEDLLDDAELYLELRHGVVHGRPGRQYRRQYTGEVYESRRWVRERGQEPRLVTTVYDRNGLLLASVRATNVAADLLAGLEGWQRQKARIRRAQREALGPGHPLRVERPPGADRVVGHALSVDAASTLCGRDVTDMETVMVPHSVTGAPDHELLFEDSDDRFHCKVCRTVSGLNRIT